MSKKAADLIERLRYPDDSIAVRLEAATVLEWQAKEIRHLAHRVFELEAEIRSQGAARLIFYFWDF